MNHKYRAFFLAALTGIASTVNASHTSYIGAIDAIDHVFGAGGGTYSAGLSSATDDDWLVFNASAGDNLTIKININTWFANAVLLQDTGNGSFAVGDMVGVTNFNSNRVGAGSPLQILSHIGPGDLEFHSSVTATLNFLATYTGEYGIAISSANEASSFNWTVQLSGNTGGGAVPDAGSSAGLLGLALAGLVALRRHGRRA